MKRFPIAAPRDGLGTSVSKVRLLQCGGLVRSFVGDEHAQSLRRCRQSGVTLLELMMVVMLIALIAGLSYPSVSSGIDSMRLRSASDGIVGFLNTALDRAERRQQVVEIWISPRDNAMVARSADQGFTRRFELPSTIRIVSVQPSAPLSADEPREFFCYPGGTAPRVAVEIASASGRRRMVSVDPITGVPRSEVEVK